MKIERISTKERNETIGNMGMVDELLLMKYFALKSRNLDQEKWYKFSCCFSANMDMEKLKVANPVVVEEK